MLFIHPIIQLSAAILACYVLHLGLKRFAVIHLNRKSTFLWKRHVVLGLMALITLLAGMAGGLAMVYTYWRGYFITGLHATVALVLLPLMLFGILSGLYMNTKKRKRKWFPLAHAANNVIIILLSVVQIVTGWQILTTYVMGR